MKIMIAGLVCALALCLNTGVFAADWGLCDISGTTITCDNDDATYGGNAEWIIGVQADHDRILACAYDSGEDDYVQVGWADFSSSQFLLYLLGWDQTSGTEMITMIRTAATWSAECEFDAFSTELPYVEPDIDGRRGADYIYGSDNRDVIYGGAGAYVDVIYGRYGNDELTGGDGNDIIHGNEDDDYIHGGDNNDTLYGESGEDTIYCGTYSAGGDDTVYGGSDDDYISCMVSREVWHGDCDGQDGYADWCKCGIMDYCELPL